MTDNTDALPPLGRAIDDYLDGYVLEGDDGYHVPTEHEKLIVKDAIMGLLEEPEFCAALAQRQQAAPSAQAEPVAWRYRYSAKARWNYADGPANDPAVIEEPLYAAPPTAQAELQVPLTPIERDEHIDRTYIPLPGGWEVQTKGKGSTFRLCDTKTGDRWPVLEERLHEALERMAREVRAAHGIGKQEGK